MDINELILEEGRKYFPSLKYKLSVTKKDPVPKPRMCYGNQKHIISVFMGVLGDKKFSVLMKQVVLENTTIARSGSVYGLYKGQDVRISRHPCCRNYTISVVVKWDTDVDKILANHFN